MKKPAQEIRWLLRRIAARLGPDTRDRQLQSEADYWEQWLETKGAGWAEDYAERMDPAQPLKQLVSTYVDRVEHDPIDILDVGAGPMTKMGKVHPSKRVSITAVDLLADDYNATIDKLGLTPPIRTQACDAERLTEHFGEQQFDIVHAENSIDHSHDAWAAVQEMFAVTRPGGYLLLEHSENEGRTQCYRGLHKWDFRHENGRFIIAGPGPDGPVRDITALFEKRAQVECWPYDEGVCVAIAKAADG
jgi:SAM-dependent methyltransferase